MSRLQPETNAISPLSTPRMHLFAGSGMAIMSGPVRHAHILSSLFIFSSISCHCMCGAIDPYIRHNETLVFLWDPNAILILRKQEQKYNNHRNISKSTTRVINEVRLLQGTEDLTLYFSNIFH